MTTDRDALVRLLEDHYVVREAFGKTADAILALLEPQPVESEEERVAKALHSVYVDEMDVEGQEWKHINQRGYRAEARYALTMRDEAKAAAVQDALERLAKAFEYDVNAMRLGVPVSIRIFAQAAREKGASRG